MASSPRKGRSSGALIAVIITAIIVVGALVLALVTNGGDVTLVWDAEGILQWSYA